LRLIPPPFMSLHGLSRPVHFPRHLGALLLVLAIAACGGGGGGGSNGTTAPVVPGTTSPVVQVSITPTSANVDVGTGTQSFSATVTNSTNTAVSWQVGSVAGGNATLGLVSASGMYSAPASLPTPATVTVTAVSAADPTKQASATVSLVPPTVPPPPGMPSVPNGLAASNVSLNSVTLSWTASTDAGGPGIGGYYVYRNGNQIATVSSGTSYTDTALVASTTYRYQVAAFDTAAPPMVSAQSSALAVTTLADTQAPTVPTGLAASNVGPNIVTFNWTASTDAGGPGIGGYYVYRNGNPIATVSSGTSYTDAALTTSTTYSYQVAAFDTANPPLVSALSSALAVTTLADTQAPTVPTGLAASNVSTTSATLTWNASTDLPNPGGAGVGGYIVYRNGTQIASVTTTSYNDAGLTPSTSYSYTVAAFDKAIPANLSAASAALIVMTVPDTQPPTAPSALTATTASSTQINLSWTASTDNVGVTNYLIERCPGASCSNFAQIATFPTTTYNNTGLSASSSYSYRVRATDAAGNLSPFSNTATAITSNAGTVGNVQSAAQDPAAGNTVSVTYAAAQTAGNLNVVVVGWNDSISSVASVTDSRNNTYLVAAGPTTYAGNATQVIYYAQNIAAGANTVTVTFNTTVNSPDVRVLEYSGIMTSAALDVSAGASGSGTSLSSGTSTTTNANDLLVGANYIGGGFVAVGSGYTQRLVTNPDADLVEDRLVSATGSYSATSTQSPASWWVMQMAAFRTAGGSSTPTISPRNAALTLSQAQQFTTNAPGGTTLTWGVDGMPGGTGTVGTISPSGLYTPPASGGTHTVSAVNPINPAFSVSAAVAVTDLSGITTYHNDVARTGQNLQEYALTPTSVSGSSFGKRWSCPLDGAVYAQPLYVANLAISGGTHNVLFVVTMNDSIYAFDADNPTCVIYWQDSFINPSAGVTTQSSADATCNDTPGNYGITGTPVIDPVALTIYLVAATTENGSSYFQRLHALNIATGVERTHSPAVIQATVPGTGDYGTTVTFNPLYQNQRLGLALTSGGEVVIGWSSHCDNYKWPWHGWIMLYNATSLAQTAVFNDTPNGAEAGIWMSGGAPALDSDGNMFVSTGNGQFDATSAVTTPPAPNNDYGESFINLDPSTLAVRDFYTPSQNANWSSNDLDLSSGGITVLPDGDGPTAHPNVLVGSDKQGHLWMIDRSRMSGFSPGADNTVQYLQLPDSTCYTNDQCVYATPAYLNGTVYIAIEFGPLMALQLSNGLFQQSGGTAIAASRSAETYLHPSPTPMISASPSGGTIVWVLDNNANGSDDGAGAVGPAILRAYDATNLGTRLYSSDALLADAGGNAAKFTLPVVANGHVYVAGAGALTVYGLAP
jgi:chitodextrinase